MKLKTILKNLALMFIGERTTNCLLRFVHNLKTKVFRFVKHAKNGLGWKPITCVPRKFGDEDHQVFFGYYDISPISEDDAILLATRAPASNSPPKPNTVLQVGFYDLNDDHNGFIHVGNTTTWCWQQGCRLQWFPLREQGRSSKIIYNRLLEGRYGCVIQDIQSKKVETKLSEPLYSVSPDGKYGLTLNFSRLQRLRPGYGYVGLGDETIGQLAPADDGIWHVDMQTGETSLVFSVADMACFEPLETMKGAEHYFNHISINPTGTRFLFFHIWLIRSKRYTRAMTCNVDGSEPYALINEGHVSHHTWKNNEEILCFSTHADSGMKYHLYEDKTSFRRVVGNGVLNEDGHPSYSPDGQFILTDTYPNKYSDRHILLFDVSNERVINLGGFFSPYKYRGEVRCDLHPRWSPSVRYIAFDSTMDGRRAIYLIDFKSQASKGFLSLPFS